MENTGLTVSGGENRGLCPVENRGTVSGGEHGTVSGGEHRTDCGGWRTRDCGGGEHGTVGKNTENRRPAHACSVTAGPADRIKVCNGWATDTRLATGTRRRPDDSYKVPDTSISCIPGTSSVRASLSGRVRAAANAVPVMRSAAAVGRHRLTDSPQKRQSCTAEHATRTTSQSMRVATATYYEQQNLAQHVPFGSAFLKACLLTSTEDVNSVPVQCCFTSTEAVRTIRDGEPWTATPTFTQLLSSVR